MSDLRPTFFFMLILHTSDWHLGRTLHQQDLHAAQASALSQILTLVREESVDVTIIAGDIFDRAVPPVAAVTLFTETLARLADMCEVVVISGNHDSAIRLGYGSELFRPGIHIVTNTADVGSAVTVSRDDVSVRIYPIPFLVPDHAREVLKTGDEPLERSHQAVVSAALERIRIDRQDPVDRYQLSVIVAHAFVTGAHGSDSERDISVGGIDDVNARVFAGFDYVALGHLHGPQDVSAPGTTRIRYSGSPLRYSFSEADQAKSVTLVDLDRSGVRNIELRPIEQPRQMAVLTGGIDEILAESNQSTHKDSWVQVIVTDDARPTDLVTRIHAAFPHALSIIHRPTNATKPAGLSRQALAAMTSVEVATEFVTTVTNRDATDAEVALLQRAYDATELRVQ